MARWISGWGILPWVLVCYALGAFVPGPAIELRRGYLGISIPACLLGLLLFLAGYAVEWGRLRTMLRRPGVLLHATLATVGVPVLLVLMLTLLLPIWLPAQEWEPLLMGLALIAAMPVAGSSTVWCQHANGDLALSLGLLVFSTLLSPITTPWALALIGGGIGGQSESSLLALATADAGHFLMLYVLVPSLVGIVARNRLPIRVVEHLRPRVRWLGRGTLLVLLYLNAAVALPTMVNASNWGSLSRIVVVVGFFGIAIFTAGWLVGRGVGLNRDGRVALMLGLGMTNNGTGLVLASSVLGHLPQVLVPLLIYNLVQHLLASVVERQNRHVPI